MQLINKINLNLCPFFVNCIDVYIASLLSAGLEGGYSYVYIHLLMCVCSHINTHIYMYGYTYMYLNIRYNTSLLVLQAARFTQSV